MRFRKNVKELNDALNVVTHAMPAHAAKSILESVFVQCENNELVLACSDGVMTIIYRTDAEVLESGVVALPGRILCEIVRKLPGDGTAFFDVNSVNTLTLKCYGSRSTLAGSDGSLFPSFPQVDVQKQVWMPQPLLKEMITQTVFAVAPEESNKRIITGELLEVSGGRALMVAIDGFRMAVRRSKVENGASDFSCVIPGKLMNELSKFLSDDEESRAEILLGERQMRMNIGDHIVVYATMLEGEFIDYKRVMPTSFTTSIIVDRDQLASCIERAGLFARESRMNQFIMKIGPDKTVVTSNSEYGDLYEELDTEFEGEEMTIGFNVRYFTDVMRVVSDEKVKISFNGSTKPCILGPVDGEDYAFMVLPLRLHA